jgi:hypothetical protein
MSDMTDCSYKKGSVSENDVNNDYLNPITGFVVLIHLMINMDMMMVSLNISLLIYLLFP